MKRILPALLVAACSTGAAAKPSTPAAPAAASAPAARTSASAGVHDAALADLLEREWTWAMQESPVTATSLGDHRFDDRIGDVSLAARQARQERRRAFVAEARARKERGGLDASDTLTLDLLIEDLDTTVAVDAACDLDDWTVSATTNPVADWNVLPELHKVVSPADGAHLVARYRAIPRSIDTTVENLARGLAAGKVANATSIKIALAMVDKQLAVVDADWPLDAPAKAEHPGWSDAERAGFAGDVAAALGGIRASTVKWRAFVADKLLPRARTDEQVGLGALPGGATCYAALIRSHTSLPLAAEELHQLGLSEIARINGEMVTLGKKLFGTGDLAKILARLRTDPTLYFQTEDEVFAKAQATLAAAKARIPEFFGILPKADCVVRRVPDYEAPYTTIAYYREPNPDGSKPGEYYVNTTQPTTRPRYEAEALAFHESIPGHHLQIAIAQELPEMPAFRKFGGVTAYVEGWGLYSERLAGEMGLYSDDLARLGSLSYEAWRASRLVVDTGMHAKGWSREQAVTYMMAHTALAENNVRNEVDRYIGWPGQALAYKVGQLTILRLRDEARAKLGAKFDLKGFHDAVLGVGPVTMKVLEAEVAKWVARRMASRK